MNNNGTYENTDKNMGTYEKDEKEEKEQQEDINEKKIISIKGTTTRYQMKKVLNIKNPSNKQRVVTQKWVVPLEYLESSLKQYILLKENETNETNETNFIYNLMVQEIKRKLNSYKYQDVLKGRYSLNEFITFDYILNQLVESKLNCIYCLGTVFILYQKVRENKQWTVERIQNNLGHNIGNTVICCLECNLKRRTQNQEKFLFTKQMKLTKVGFFK